MKIFIIGMPLSGKTTISIEYSKTYNREFLDLDSLIERDNLYFKFQDTVYCGIFFCLIINNIYFI